MNLRPTLNYEKLVREYGDSPLSLGWGSKDRREIRFKYLLEPWSLDQATIVDVGAGFGDLYSYARKSHSIGKYIGLDKTLGIVEIARKKYPEAEFLLKDYLKDDIPTADFLFASGILNDFCWRPQRRLKKTLDLLFQKSNLGFSINFLSHTAKIKYSHANYTKVEDVLSLASTYGTRFILNHSYMPFEFTLHFSKSSDFSKETAVFESRF
jgi:trans-aconitate methyltransferase